MHVNVIKCSIKSVNGKVVGALKVTVLSYFTRWRELFETSVMQILFLNTLIAFAIDIYWNIEWNIFIPCLSCAHRSLLSDHC